jgi:hypothetical protein
MKLSENRRKVALAYYYRHVGEIAEKRRIKNAALPKKGGSTGAEGTRP